MTKIKTKIMSIKENKRGGTREGAGAKPKPFTQKKVPVTVYPAMWQLMKLTLHLDLSKVKSDKKMVSIMKSEYSRIMLEHTNSLTQ